MIATVLAAFTTLASCANRCPCTVAPGHDTLSVLSLVGRDFRAAHAVFSGSVLRLDTLKLDSLLMTNSQRPVVEPGLLRYRVAVLEYWKGPLSDTVDVIVERPYMTCGHSLDVGQQYLLFTYPGPDGKRSSARVSVDACSRVELLVASRPTRDLLGSARSRRRR